MFGSLYKFTRNNQLEYEKSPMKHKKSFKNRYQHCYKNKFNLYTVVLELVYISEKFYTK